MRNQLNDTGGRRSTLIVVTGLFFLSGSAGLVYQVLWMRSLGLFFGSDMFGVSIILSTFIGGLSLGSLVGGRLAERVARPLLWYGAAELGIGVFALLFPIVLKMFDPLLLSLYSENAAGLSWTYQITRVLVASGSLLIPTTFMGATLPLIMRHFVRERAVLGKLAAYFYAVNTLGAVVGTMVGGFVLLPYLGMKSSTLVAAAINLSIGALCVGIGLRELLPAALRARAPGSRDALDTLPGMEATVRLRIARAALIAFGVSGFASFALEVVWTRILLISFSATVYSFASMLACFLLGIFLGSVVVSRYVDRHEDPVRLFSMLELGIGLCVAVLCLLINVVPGFFAGILRSVSGILGADNTSVLPVTTLVTSFLLLVLPTSLLGATFSVALRVYTMNVARIGSRTGNLYASNTLGAILGSLCGGLLLIPILGTRASLAFISLIFVINGIYLMSAQGRAGFRAIMKPAMGLPILGAIFAAIIGAMMPYRVTLNFNQHAGSGIKLLYHAEGIQDTIDVVRSRSGVTSLVIGGNVEADNGYTQMRHFTLKGHLPLMFVENPRSVLVVGLGMGITLRATARHAELDQIDVIELSPEILEVQAQLRDINDDVARNSLVRIRIEDGRSYLKMSRAKYDMITADPIHPKISRVGYLYTKEYYESIKDRLNDGGVVCQWMPIYQISPARLRSAMKTFLEVFPNATFWYVKNHGLLIAKRDSPLLDYGLLMEKFADPFIREDMESIDINSPEDLLSLLLMGPAQIRAFVDAEAAVPTNTDDYPYLEYFVPGDLFYNSIDNVRELVKFPADPTQFVANQSPHSIAKVRALIRDRPTRLISELEAARSAPR